MNFKTAENLLCRGRASKMIAPKTSNFESQIAPASSNRISGIVKNRPCLLRNDARDLRKLSLPPQKWTSQPLTDHEWHWMPKVGRILETNFTVYVGTGRSFNFACFRPTGPFWNAWGRSWTLKDARGCSAMLWDALGHSGTLYFIFHSFILFFRPGGSERIWETLGDSRRLWTHPTKNKQTPKSKSKKIKLDKFIQRKTSKNQGGSRKKVKLDKFIKRTNEQKLKWKSKK